MDDLANARDAFDAEIDALRAVRDALDDRFPRVAGLLRDALARGGTIGAGRVARVALYAATYCGFVLSCGCLAFRDRDL